MSTTCSAPAFRAPVRCSTAALNGGLGVYPGLLGKDFDVLQVNDCGPHGVPSWLVKLEKSSVDQCIDIFAEYRYLVCRDIHAARLARLAQPTNAPTIELA